jgi:hypothetical protein
MFDSKQNKLFEVEKTTSVNSFLTAGKVSASTISSGNGAVKYSTTQNEFIDQFVNAGAYKKPRTYKEVSNDMAVLWAKDKMTTVQLTVYFRIITRDIVLNNEKIGVHKGAGLKNEAIQRMLWLGINHKKAFTNNIKFFCLVNLPAKTILFE